MYDKNRINIFYPYTKMCENKCILFRLHFYTYKENTFLNHIFLIISYEIINAKLLNNKLYCIKNSTKIIDCDDFVQT